MHLPPELAEKITTAVKHRELVSKGIPVDAYEKSKEVQDKKEHESMITSGRWSSSEISSGVAVSRAGKRPVDLKACPNKIELGPESGTIVALHIFLVHLHI